VDWIYLAQDRVQWRIVVKTPMNLGLPQNARAIISFSRVLLFHGDSKKIM